MGGTLFEQRAAVLRGLAHSDSGDHQPPFPVLLVPPPSLGPS